MIVRADNVPYFNPRSLAGATAYYLLSLPDKAHFNPRSLAGATRMDLMLLVQSRLFQSTLPRGSDVNQYKNISCN